jgi:hypothetical protein
VSLKHYTHPEFGFLSPAPRLRRELRLAVVAGAFGAVIGAAGVIALSSTDRNDNPASLVRALPTQARPQPTGAPEHPPTRAGADIASNSQAPSSSKERQTLIVPSEGRTIETNHATGCEDRSSFSAGRPCSPKRLHRGPRAADNGPEIARVPLGRPAVLAAPAVAARADSASASSRASMPPPTAQADAGKAGPAADQHGASELQHSAPAADPKPQKAIRVEKARHKETPDSTARIAAAPDSAAGSIRSAYARDVSYPRTVFWDWSR